jgi:F-type H+-transporting ATPase subunit b
MDATLQALGGILLRAIPTLILLILLHLYLKAVFFRPLKRILKQRYDATEGARNAAKAAMDRAAQKATEYEDALRRARAEMYREQEEARHKWLEEQARQIDESHKRSRESVHEAKQRLDAEAATARRELESSSASLADEITRVVLEGRPA